MNAIRFAPTNAAVSAEINDLVEEAQEAHEENYYLAHNPEEEGFFAPWQVQEWWGDQPLPDLVEGFVTSQAAWDWYETRHLPASGYRVLLHDGRLVACREQTEAEVREEDWLAFEDVRREPLWAADRAIYGWLRCGYDPGGWGTTNPTHPNSNV